MSLDKTRFGVVAGLSGFAFLGAFGTQVKLQGFERDETISLAQRVNRWERTRVDPPRRGAILDRTGAPLAAEESAAELCLDYRKLPESEAFFNEVSAVVGIPSGELRPADDGRNRSWRVTLTTDDRHRLEEVRRDFAADGLSLRNSDERSYPGGAATACLLGTIRRVADPKTPAMTGLEKVLDERLRGEAGKTVGFTDRNNRFLPGRTDDGSAPRRDGANVRLTLDARLQKSCYEAVREAVEKNGATAGVAVVVDPKTGDLLALANYPSFDPLPGGGRVGKNAAGLNMATMNVYEPGSMFKILTLAKGLDAGKVHWGDHLYCRGELGIGKRSRVRCDAHHGVRAHGDVTPEIAIAKSCNVAAATWALRIGGAEYVEYMTDLGLFERSGLGLPSEARGRYNPNDYAKALQLANMGFGQAMGCTPLALAGAFATIANGGVRMPLRLIASVDGKATPIPEGERVVSEESAALTLRAMEAVVESKAGTGFSLRIPGYRMAGKTGTAQKVGKGGARGYVSNFIGMIPADRPRASVLVMIDDPKKQYYGAAVAGPAFQRIARSVIARLEIPKTETVPAPEVVSRVR